MSYTLLDNNPLHDIAIFSWTRSRLHGVNNNEMSFGLFTKLTEFYSMAVKCSRLCNLLLNLIHVYLPRNTILSSKEVIQLLFKRISVEDCKF